MAWICGLQHENEGENKRDNMKHNARGISKPGFRQSKICRRALLYLASVDILAWLLYLGVLRVSDVFPRALQPNLLFVTHLPSAALQFAHRGLRQEADCCCLIHVATHVQHGHLFPQAFIQILGRRVTADSWNRRNVGDIGGYGWWAVTVQILKLLCTWTLTKE